MANTAQAQIDPEIEVESRKFTWGEFKKLCEQHGISDGDVIDDIDISWGKREFFSCEKDEVYGWKISLVSI